MNEKKIEPFWAGYEAYESDKPIGDNPYPYEPSQWDARTERYRDAHNQWIHGWETAERDALRGDDDPA